MKTQHLYHAKTARIRWPNVGPTLFTFCADVGCQRWANVVSAKCPNAGATLAQRRNIFKMTLAQRWSNKRIMRTDRVETNIGYITLAQRWAYMPMPTLIQPFDHLPTYIFAVWTSIMFQKGLIIHINPVWIFEKMVAAVRFNQTNGSDYDRLFVVTKTMLWG